MGRGKCPEERKFHGAHDSSEHVHWKQATAIRIPNLKSCTRIVSLRRSEGLLEKITVETNRRDIPYQLLKAWLAKLHEEKTG